MNSLQAHFERLEEAFVPLLADLSNVLSREERDSVELFLNACEYGIALDMLAAIIRKGNKRISSKTLRQIQNLAQMMKTSQPIERWGLEELVVGDSKEEASDQEV